MLRPFYRERDQWSCDDIIQLFATHYKNVNVSQRTWFSQEAVNCLIKGCYIWDEVGSKNYFAKHHKELNPFRGSKGEDDFGWRTCYCVPVDHLRVMVSAFSDYAIKIYAQFLYPLFDENFKENMVFPALESLGIDTTECHPMEAKTIFSAVKVANKILSDPDAYLDHVRRKHEDTEKRKAEELRLRKEGHKKFWTMLCLGVIFYVISCFMYNINGKDGALWRSLIWLLWSISEIVTFAAWDVKSELTKLPKIYTVVSFLSVPIIAFVFVFLFQAYNNNVFLRLTMILYAPAGYFITWIVFFVHIIILGYIEDLPKNHAR